MDDEYICRECGGEMEDIGVDILVCKKCGFSIDVEDYGEDPDEYEDYYESIKPESIPEYCNICGGPYPDCMTSCNLFDD